MKSEITHILYIKAYGWKNFNFPEGKLFQTCITAVCKINTAVYTAGCKINTVVYTAGCKINTVVYTAVF